MKRDARLRRLGERRQPHGGRWRTVRRRGRHATLESLLNEMAMRAGLASGAMRVMAVAMAEAREAHQAFIDNELRPWAAVVTADLTAKLRGGLDEGQRLEFDAAYLAV